MVDTEQKKKPFYARPLSLLTLGHAVVDLSPGALPVLLPLLKSMFGLTYAQVGIIVMAQNITSSVIQPLFGYLSDRMSMPWLIPLGILFSGIGITLTGHVTSFNLLLIIVMLTGFGVAAFHPQGSKGAHFVSTPERRGQDMAIFSVGGQFGYSLGTIAMAFLITLPGGIANTTYFGPPALITAALLWLSMAQISPRTPVQAAANKKESTRGPLPYLLLGILLTYILFRSTIGAGLSTYIPLYYVDHLKGSPIYAGYLLSIYTMTGVLGTFAGGILSDRLGRKTVIILSLAISWPLIALFPYTTGITTLVLVGAIGFTLVASSSPTLVLAQEMMPGYEAMAAGLTTGFSIGLGGVGATILGVMADSYGINSVFTALAVLPLGTIIMGIFLPGKWFKREIPSAQ